jgi:hypothetical protein
MKKRTTLLLVVVAAVCAAVASASARPPTGSSSDAATCQLGNGIKHVIYIQFDNTHLERDNPNVPADLEQMPNLENFIEGNGTMMANDHTVLISHTATGILTSLTGVYPDRMGQPVSNSYRYYSPNGSTHTGVAFAYWTAPVFDPAGAATDTSPTMINENQKVAPAPWVPYTRDGCNFGAVATANTILENTAIDIPTVFGANSPQAQEVASNPGQAFADFVGIGVHCAQGSSLCSAANGGRADLLPDEPGAPYQNFNGLFGATYVDPLIFPGGTPTDLDGHTIQDAAGHIGFPGFDGMEASVSLSWVAHMQEAGIPITYAYISDAHDGHGTSGNIHFAYGPGEGGDLQPPGYVQQLRDYNTAFGKFFTDLAAHGIDKSNTLFVFTVDEGDHFVGDAPTPAGCDGVNTLCHYNRVGEINADLGKMIRTQFSDNTAFTVHSDDAPNVYVTGSPTDPIPGQTEPAVRNLEREMSHLNWLNPYTNTVENNIMVALADHTEMKTLHMVTTDPNRTPTFTPFADPNWFFFATGGTTTCATQAACAFIPARTSQSFAWNHGDIQDEIASTWVGYVGPGVRNLGTSHVWTDHTDVRPTIMTLLGLKDDYTVDGRAVLQPLFDSAVPQTLRAHRETLLRLGDVYKQLNASFGAFAMDTLKASTKALASGSSSNDETYTTLESAIANLTAERDTLAGAIKNGLAGAEFGATPLNEQQAKGWIDQAQDLLNEAAALAAS